MELFRRLKRNAITKRKSTTVLTVTATGVLCCLMLSSKINYVPDEALLNSLKSEEQSDDEKLNIKIEFDSISLKRKDRYNGITKGDLSWIQTPEDFFRRLEKEESQTKCRRMVEMGGSSCNRISDGSKMVCLDPDVNLVPWDCTVYSFGVSTEISFDNAIASYGCAVYMMDPTLPKGAYSRLKGRQKFFPIGLGNKNTIHTLNLTSFADWQGLINVTIAVYSDIRKFIGPSGDVHYLKMDIEGSEWVSLEHMMDHDLLQGIKQIAVEIHEMAFASMAHDDAVAHLKKRWQLIERLEDQGFLRVHYTPTLAYEAVYAIPGTNRTMQTCGELFLVRRSSTTK